jgi:hypothetical protein
MRQRMVEKWIVAEVNSSSGDWEPEYFENEKLARQRYNQRRISSYLIYLLKIIEVDDKRKVY